CGHGGASAPQPRNCRPRHSWQPLIDSQTCETYAGDNRRRCATEELTASISRSTCSAVFDRPREKRRLDLAFCAGRPMAVSTWDGSTAPLEQADPLDTANPFRSSAITSDSPSIPSKHQFVVVGERNSLLPLMETSETPSRIPCSRRSRS